MTKSMEFIFTITIYFMILSNECSEFRKINSINHSIIKLERVIVFTSVKDPPPAVNVVS